jgi:RecB family endonuclease NucS
MIVFDRTIGEGEEKSYYLNLTDNAGNRYGSKFPDDRTPLWVITEGRRYKASKRGENQIWGRLRAWYEGENVHSGDTIHIRYEPTANKLDGRTPIEISIVKRVGKIEEERVEISTEQGEIEEVERIPAEISIQIEHDLEDFLTENLSLIKEGLKLYIDERGREGRQYPTDVGTIDLLCKDNEDFVIIELKKGRASDPVVGQISRYIGWVRENLSEGHNVRGIIIVHDFDPKLKYAVLAHDNLEIKYYEIQIKFISEQEVIDRIERENNVT